MDAIISKRCAVEGCAAEATHSERVTLGGGGRVTLVYCRGHAPSWARPIAGRPAPTIGRDVPGGPLTGEEGGGL